jgi:hypothetical protein
VKKVIAHPDVDHRRLRRNRLHRRVRINAGQRCGESVIRSADRACTSIVVLDVFNQPRDSVVSIGALIYLCFVVMGHDGPAHDELALRLISTANILVDEDVAAARQFRTSPNNALRCGSVHSIRSAIEQKRQRVFCVGGSQNNRVQPDAVTHRDHHFLARVGAESVVHGLPDPGESLPSGTLAD